MARILIALIATAAVVLLSDCSPTQQAKVQAFISTTGADVKAVASGILAAADAACADALPVIKTVAVLVNNTKVNNILSYVTPICSPVGTVVAGANIDASTASWIGGIKAGLAAAANLNVPTPVAPAAAPATPVAIPPTSAPAAAPVVVAVPAVAIPAPASP